MHKSSGPAYRVDLIASDMVLKGWLKIDLARHAKTSHMTVARFLSGERQTPRTAKKIARALGHGIERYVGAPAEVVAP